MTKLSGRVAPMATVPPAAPLDKIDVLRGSAGSMAHKVGGRLARGAGGCTGGGGGYWTD